MHLTSDHEELEVAEEAWEAVERRRGAVPPLRFGDRTLEEARRRVGAIDEALADVLGGALHDPRPVAVDVVLPADGERPATRVQGIVDDVCADKVLTVTASRFKPRDHLTAWVRLAALAAQDPTRPWEAVTLARNPKSNDKATVKVARVRLVDPDRALDVLALVDDLRRRALADVVPAFPGATHALWCGGLSDARKAWEHPFDGEGNDRWVATAVGADFEAVLALPARADEPGAAADTGRLGWWARRIWGAFEDTTGSTVRDVPLPEGAAR